MDVNTTFEIVVIGSANVDFIMKMARLPREGETITNATFGQAMGGKGANQAVAAARSSRAARAGAPANGKVSFVAAIGNDQYAADMLTSWTESGVDRDRVTQVDDHTGSALIMIGEGGSNYISAAPAANNHLLPEHIDSIQSLLAGASYILIQFEIPEPTTQRILEMAAKMNAPAVWNVAPVRAVRRDLIGMAEIVVVNETEAEVITGLTISDATEGDIAVRAEAAGQAIRKLGTASVIVTLGEAGSVVVSEAGVESVPAFAVDAVDTTAAGDTYCGCLVTALSEGCELSDAVRFASAGAALSVGRLGAQPSIPWRPEIDELLRNSPGIA